jgi:hypothetical protein
MNFRVRYHPEVFSEIIAVSKWYEIQSEGLGSVFQQEFHQFIRFLTENPNTAVKTRNNSRLARMEKFPYYIEYDVFEDELVVLGLFHAARNPNVRERAIRKRRK